MEPTSNGTPFTRLFPEYRFEPAIAWTPLNKERLIKYNPLLAICLLAAVWVVLYYAFPLYYFAIILIVYLSISIPFILSCIDIGAKKATPLAELADYVQPYTVGGTSRNPKYTFFVKNDKMGLLNVTAHNIAIPAQYDSLFWREKGKILSVRSGAEQFEIDLLENRLK